MQTFEYVVMANEGLHARPAGSLVQQAKKFKCEIKMKSKDKEGNVKKLFALLKLGVKKGDAISVMFEGEDEVQAFTEISQNIKENF